MKFAMVCKNIGSLRMKNDFNSILADEVLYGMKLEILEELDDWYLIKTHYRYQGYIHKSELIKDEILIHKFEKKERLMINHPYVDIRSEPNVHGVRIISLVKGCQIARLSQADKNGWVEVYLLDGKVGYVKEKFVSSCIKSLIRDEYKDFNVNMNSKDRIRLFLNQRLGITEEEFRQNIVDTADEYLDVQYRWGGKTHFGIDCSGFCSMVYMLNGIIIYRDSKIKEGFPMYEISIDEMDIGDIMFFDGHVAIYTGDSEYLHATAKNGSDGVDLNSLDPEEDDYYREDLAKGIKMVGSIF